MLLKINFQLSNFEIEEVAECKDLAIEQLLFRLKRHVENFQRVVTVSHTSKRPRDTNDTKVNANRINSSKASNSNNANQLKMIKDLTETVEILEQKLQKMDEMMKVKDDKIRYLTRKLNDAEGGAN